MATIVEALDLLASKNWWKEWQNPAWKQFVASGDEALLKKLPKYQNSWLPPELLAALPESGEVDEGVRRFLRACLSVDHPSAIGAWLAKCYSNGSASTEPF